jgi:hypothetical protein
MKGTSKAISNFASRLIDFFGINNPTHFLFLILLGVLSAITGYLIDWVS